MLVSRRCASCAEALSRVFLLSSSSSSSAANAYSVPASILPPNRALVNISWTRLYSSTTLPFLLPRLSSQFTGRGVQASKSPRMAVRRRPHTTKAAAAKPETAAAHVEHTHEHEHDDAHSHSHSVFGLHSHAHHDPRKAESVMKVFSGHADRGSRITLLGLVVNVGLTASKGVAGWFMNSAALLAEAGHSASGMLPTCSIFTHAFKPLPQTFWGTL